MTINLFIFILTIGSVASSLLTEAIKKAFDNAKKEYSANLIALVNAIVVGCGGCAIAYIYMGIEFNAVNIICLILMSLCVWVGEMIGYDKVIQLVAQIKG